MEIAGVLQLLAARQELQQQYAGSCYAMRRSGLALALLLQSLCTAIFFSEWATLRSFLLVIELVVLIYTSRHLSFASYEPGDFVVHAGIGAGIAWACIALCFEAQAFAKDGSALSLTPLAVVRGLGAAAGLAVFTKYDWVFASLMAIGLFDMSKVALLEGDAPRARLFRRGAMICCIGALLALRCTWRQLRRAQRPRGDSDSDYCIKRVDSSIENLPSGG